jgi:hypothetical protein
MSYVPAVTVSNVRQLAQATYEEETAHHVHAAAETGEEADLVRRNHPLAAGLERAVSQRLYLHAQSVLIASCVPPI